MQQQSVTGAEELGGNGQNGLLDLAWAGLAGSVQLDGQNFEVEFLGVFLAHQADWLYGLLGFFCGVRIL